MQDLKFSIVIPSFNQGRFIEKTLRSILDQGHSSVEIIVIDGGSADQTKEILEKYAGHIAFWVSEPDKGQSDAIAKGFKHATGDIFAWLNSDDVYLPEAFRRVNRVFQEQQADVVYGNKQIIDQYGAVVARRYLTPFLPTFIRDAFFCGGFGLYQPATFWRRELYLRCGGIDSSLYFCMDNDLFNKFVIAGAEFSFIDQELAGFRVHTDSKTSTSRSVARKEQLLLRQRYVVDRGVRLERLKRLSARLYRLSWFALNGRLSSVLRSRYLERLKWVP